MPPVKKASSNTIVKPEVIDFNFILSSLMSNQQKISQDLTHARRRIVELEAQIYRLSSESTPAKISPGLCKLF